MQSVIVGRAGRAIDPAATSVQPEAVAPKLSGAPSARAPKHSAKRHRYAKGARTGQWRASDVRGVAALLAAFGASRNAHGRATSTICQAFALHLAELPCLCFP